MKYISLILILLTFFGTEVLAKKVFELTDKKDDDGAGIEYLIDTADQYNIDSVLRPSIFKKFKAYNENNVPNFGQIYFGIWFSFKTVCNNIHELNKTYLIVVDNAQIDSLSLYSFENNVLLSSQIQGLKVPYQNRFLEHHSLIYTVKHTKLGEQTHFMLMKGRDTKYLPISFNTLHDFLIESSKTDTYAALFVGFFLAMIFYNLFLFISTREKAFIFYVLYMFMFMTVQLSIQGYLIRIFPDLSWHSFSINLILLAATSFFAIEFSKSFLQIAVINKKLANLSYLVDSLVFIAMICSISTFFTDTLDPFLNIFIIIVILAGVGIILLYGFFAYRRKIRAAPYFLIAWGMLLVGIFFRSMSELNLFPFNFFTLYASQIGSILEMLLLSMGLADRINQAKVQISKAQLNTIELLKQSEQSLEKKVSLRTVELQMLNNELNKYLSQLQSEKKKSENLLLNILPEEVANELKLKGEATPKYFDQVTVLFADLVNFTSYAAQNKPQAIIEKLDELFEDFDDVCVRHGLEKIKTIGDCYMAAGGLPTKNTTNAVDAVNAAIEMLAIANHNNWNLRIGIHSGPIVAGVVGKHKFAYDIWGDAVNVASRMESGSENNKINISKATYELVKNEFQCFSRGKISAKNKGDIEMFYVISKI